MRLTVVCFDRGNRFLFPDAVRLVSSLRDFPVERQTDTKMLNEDSFRFFTHVLLGFCPYRNSHAAFRPISWIRTRPPASDAKPVDKGARLNIPQETRKTNLRNALVGSFTQASIEDLIGPYQSRGNAYFVSLGAAIHGIERTKCGINVRAPIIKKGLERPRFPLRCATAQMNRGTLMDSEFFKSVEGNGRPGALDVHTSQLYVGVAPGRARA